MNLHYYEFGQGQPLIILHGLMGSADNWVTMGKRFSEHFHVFLVDQRNHGKSIHSSEFNYDLLAEDVLGFINRHKLVNPILIGHSMGGKVALKFASKYASQLHKLIIVDIGPKYYPIHHQKILAGLNAINIHSLKNRNEAELVLKEYVNDFGERQFLLKNLYRTDTGFAWRFNLESITNTIENVGEEIVGEISETLPSLFIRGKKSNYILDEDIETINDQVKNFSINTIPNSGHWVHAEAPDVFYSNVIKFLHA